MIKLLSEFPELQRIALNTPITVNDAKRIVRTSCFLFGRNASFSVNTENEGLTFPLPSWIVLTTSHRRISVAWSQERTVALSRFMVLSFCWYEA